MPNVSGKKNFILSVLRDGCIKVFHLLIKYIENDISSEHSGPTNIETLSLFERNANPAPRRVTKKLTNCLLGENNLGEKSCHTTYFHSERAITTKRKKASCNRTKNSTLSLLRDGCKEVFRLLIQDIGNNISSEYGGLTNIQRLSFFQKNANTIAQPTIKKRLIVGSESKYEQRQIIWEISFGITTKWKEASLARTKNMPYSCFSETDAMTFRKYGIISVQKMVTSQTSKHYHCLREMQTLLHNQKLKKKQLSARSE